MKLKVALFLSTVAAVSSLAAGSKPTEPPANQPPKGQSQIARGGEYRDDSLQNRENRAGNRDETNREQSLENRQNNADQHQNNREDNR